MTRLPWTIFRDFMRAVTLLRECDSGSPWYDDEMQRAADWLEEQR